MEMIDLFSGIGGFSLAWSRCGGKTIQFVERDRYCRKVLQKNFPGVPIHNDIKTFDGKPLNGTAYIISGGFPCQPFSTSGKRKGTDDDRFLWPEMLRVIQEVQPPYVVGENVSGILSMDNGDLFARILSDLESEGYEVQTFSIPASAKGAPHKRERIWIVAYNQKFNERRYIGKKKNGQKSKSGNCSLKGITSNTSCSGLSWDQFFKASEQEVRKCEPSQSVAQQDKDVVDTNGRRWNKGERGTKRTHQDIGEGYRRQFESHWFEAATSLCRVDDGLPSWMVRHRTNRLKALGNAIVPQVAFEILNHLIQR